MEKGRYVPVGFLDIVLRCIGFDAEGVVELGFLHWHCCDCFAIYWRRSESRSFGLLVFCGRDGKQAINQLLC